MTNEERNQQDIREFVDSLRKFNEELKKSPNCVKCNKLLNFDNLGWHEKSKENICNECMGRKDFMETWSAFSKSCVS